MGETVLAQDCPCTGNCGRRGNCVACIEHHRKIGSLVACMRILAKELGEKKEDDK